MHRFKQHLDWLTRQPTPLGKTIGLAGAALLLICIVAIIGIKFGLFAPKFKWFLGSVAEISAPCPPNIAFDCERHKDWQYFDVWLTTGQFDFFPDNGMIITNTSFFRLIRINIWNKMETKGMEGF